jgi:hypothetical protein
LTGTGPCQAIFPFHRGVFETMDLTNNRDEGIEVPSLLQPPNANDCDVPSCRNCEALKDRLKQLSYCLAVAQRLTNIEAV